MLSEQGLICSVFVLCCYWIVGSKISFNYPRARNIGVNVGLVLGGIFGFWCMYKSPPRTHEDHLLVLGTGIYVGVAVTATLWIVLPIVSLVAAMFIGPIDAARKKVRISLDDRKLRKQIVNFGKKLEKERTDAIQAQKEYLASLPPPKSKEEKRNEAMARYKKLVRDLCDSGLDALELDSAMRKAKQKYLNELDELL